MNSDLKHIEAYKILENYNVWLKYDDGVEGVIDFSSYLKYPAFAAWKNESFFKQMKVEKGRDVFWNENLDLCPDALYIQLTGINPYARD